MSSPIDLIREGIQKNDMSVVADGFKSLTGESVEHNADEVEPKLEKHPPEDEVVSSHKEDFIAPARSEETVQSSTGGRTRSEPIYRGERENEWADDGSIVSEDEKNLIDDSANPPVPRTRRKSIKADVTCSKCQESYKVSPSLKRDFYVCERCVG